MQTKKLGLLIFMIACLLSSYSQISISDKANQQNHSSAVLDLISDDKGFLLPRMETSDRDNINDPAESLMIFNTETQCIELWIDGWQDFWCYEPEPFECVQITFTYNQATVHEKELTYCKIVSSVTGRTWMDRNLGSVSYDEAIPETFEPQSYDDSDFQGDLFQWGRLDDGHQYRDSNETTDLSDSDNPGHDMFISTAPWDDWRETPNDDLWQYDDGTVLNNPCPDGWRVPTEQEWIDEARFDDGGWENRYDAFTSDIKLTIAGRRAPNGSIYATTSGRYWSSTVYDTKAIGLRFTSTEAGMTDPARMGGRTVRCIKN